MDRAKHLEANSNLMMNPIINLIKYPKCYLKHEEIIDFDGIIDKRIEVAEYVGTIRFVGKLKHKHDPDVWLGIEWDDYTRGKHNGIVEGVEYFKCAHPTAGSLVKFNKVNFGNSFYEAIKFKYNFFNQDTDEKYQFLNRAVESDLFIQANKKRINIELVGKEKAIEKFSKLDAIPNIDLAFSFISEIEPDLASHFPKLKDLILQKTLLNKWSQFLKILTNFKNLESINFSENILSFDESFYKMKENFNSDELKLNYLVMNKCKIDFYTLINISFVMKKVETLYLMGNELNEVNYELHKKVVDEEKIMIKNNFANIAFISLEKNKIKDFLKVYEALCLYKLSRYNLNQNHISKIINNEEEKLILDISKTNIQGLYLDFNQFSNEIEILRELSNFENLLDLDILNNNFVNKLGMDNAKSHIIGRLLKLQTLNNTSISKEFRRDCELSYLKDSVNRYVKENPILSKDTFNKEKFESYMKKNDPNYFVLKRKYFDPLEDILDNVKQVNTNTLKGNMVEVTFKYNDKSIVKKFPKTTTFANLRNLLGKLFKINGNFSFYINDEELVNDETHTLDNFSINSSNIINLK